ncbi:type IV secretory system conjugative DNA transfer family protein [Clostridium perfringens]
MLLLLLGGVGVCAAAYTMALWQQKQAEEKIERLTESQKTINNTAVLLEMSIERDTEVDIGAIEQMWTYFSSIPELDDEYFQPHISFELMAERDDYKKKDSITFFLWVPKRFENMFRARLKSIYPSMIIDVAKEDYMPQVEHGMIKDNRVMALANLGLGRHYVYSLKQFSSIKESDPIQTLISSMAKVENKEQCIVQFLLRPINDDWKEEAKDYLKEFELDGITPSSKRLDFQDKLKIYLKGGFIALSTLFFDLLTKNSKEIITKHNKLFEIDESVDKGKIENLEINNITEKINSVGYSVDIRVLVATPLGRQRAEDKLDEICASFRELDGDNRIIRKPTGNVIDFIKNISTRWYPVELDNDILSAKEVSSLCHFPNLSKAITLKKITTKIVECPPGLSTENLLGFAYRNGMKVPVGIDFESRFRHMWIGGQTGTGKSTIMESMIINDIHNGAGLLFIDPHGESTINIAERCSTERKDVYCLNVSDIVYPPSINMFEIFSSDHHSREHEKAQICESFIVIFKRVFGSASIGPNTEDILRNAAYAVLENPNGCSLLDIYLMLTSDSYRKKIIPFLDDKPALKIYWENNFAMMVKDVRFQQQNLNAPLNKLRRFINDPILANILCPKKSTINIRQAMDTGSVIMVNLSKGRLGELTANIIGSILVSQVQISTMMRSGLPQHKMTPFFLYIDEFENFIGGEGGGAAFESILSEARKYKLGLIIANQYMSQLEAGGGGVKDAIFGNCGTTGVYRVGNQDAMELEREFYNDGKGFSKTDLVSTEKYTMAIRLMNNGAKTAPFTLFVNPPFEPHPTANPEEIHRYSREMLTIHKKIAEKEIIDTMRQFDDSME